MALPQLTEEQRAAALEKAAAARRTRAELKDRLKRGGTTLGEVLKQSDTDEVLATLEERGWTGLTGAIEVEEMATPLDWAAQGMAAGTPFAVSHRFSQTGPFRPRNVAAFLLVFWRAGLFADAADKSDYVGEFRAPMRVLATQLDVLNDLDQHFVSALFKRRCIAQVVLHFGTGW